MQTSVCSMNKLLLRRKAERWRLPGINSYMKVRCDGGLVWAATFSFQMKNLYMQSQGILQIAV